LLEGVGEGEQTRCFFQRGGRVVEVKLAMGDKGVADWVLVGEVPLAA
jgi:hypothetical protein